MTQLLPFRLGLENYALDLQAIQEVVENAGVYPFPAAPDVIRGALGFHGRIVPLVSLPLLLGLEDHKLCQRYIVLINDYGPIALAVDQLKVIISVNVSQVKHLGSEDGGNFIKEVISWQGEIINLLDLDKVQSRIKKLCLQHGGLHG